MEVRAHLRFLQIAPRKVRLVVDLVRGLPIDRALDQLSHLPKRSALPVLKLVQSAVANAEHNFQLNKSDLFIKSIVANEGQKRMTHITVILGERPGAPAKPKAKSAEGATPKAEVSKLERSDIKGVATKPKPSPTKPKVRATKPAEAKQRELAAEDTTVARKGES
jgi:ribosomal protein L22